MEKSSTRVGPFGKFDKQKALRLLAMCYAMVDGWRAAFKECDQVDRILWIASNSIKDWLDNIGATIAELQNAVTPDMEYDPDPYDLGKGAAAVPDIGAQCFCVEPYALKSDSLRKHLPG